MATKLFLRNTTNNGITDTGDGIVYDMVTTAGASIDTAVVNAVASGGNIQWTDTAGGSTIAFISGRVPAGGLSLTTSNISIWARESAMTVNAGGRVVLSRYEPGPTITDIQSASDGVEFGTADAEMTWALASAATTFNENDRLLIRVQISPVGTMGSGTCTLSFNAADAATGDSFYNIDETVTFKAEETFVKPPNPTIINQAPSRAAFWNRPWSPPRRRPAWAMANGVLRPTSMGQILRPQLRKAA